MNTAFTKVPKTLGVSNFRAELARHLAQAKHAPIVISGRRGGEDVVVLSINAYNELVETWEDEQAGRTLARLVKANKGKKFIPWEQVRQAQ